jgi:hypothetical protein
VNFEFKAVDQESLKHTLKPGLRRYRLAFSDDIEAVAIQPRRAADNLVGGIDAVGLTQKR